MSMINTTITQQVTLGTGTYGSPLTITGAGAVLVGGNDAIVAPILQLGPGGPFATWTVNNYGTVAATGSGTTGSGIVFETGGAVTNGANGVISGSFAGIDIIGNDHGSANYIVNLSAITGGVAGIVVTGAGNTSVVNGMGGGGGAIFGGSVGVDLRGTGSFTVANYGSIGSGGTHSILGYGIGVAARGTFATIANFGAISATGSATIGAYIGSNGNVTNGGNGAAAALIRGGRGIVITGAGSLTNFGAISGTAGGGVSISYAAGLADSLTNGGPGASGATIIAAASYGVSLLGPGSVTNFGTIASTGTSSAGLLLSKSGSVINSGMISATEFGVQFVFVAGAPGTVRNFGTIAATATVGVVGDGVAILPGGLVTNGVSNGLGGLITGGQNGVHGATTLQNYGTVIGSAGYGAGLTVGSVFNTGLVRGGSDGIRFTGAAGTVVNLATVGGVSGFGVYAVGSGLMVNGQSGDSTARITGGSDGMKIAGTAGTVTNFATVIGTSGFGLRVSGSTSVTSSVVNGPSGATSALITGGVGGVRIDGAGTVTNFATISAAAVGGPGTGAGVFIGAGGALSNGSASATGASILGASQGVRFYNGGAGTVTNFATITASATNGAGIELDKGGSVVNGASNVTTALISGGLNGIVKATTLTNYGTVIGSTAYVNAVGAGYGVGLSGGSVFNAASGVILGASTGIRFVGSSATLVNLGRVIAAGYGGVGVYLGPAGSTVTNGGTIGGAGGAVKFAGGGANRLIVNPGAVFQGAVSASGTSTLELALGNASAGTLQGIGSTVTNFATLQFDTGAQWIVEGSAAGLPGAITGFAAGDTIDVDGFVAVSDTYTGSGLILTDAASNHATLGIQGSFSTSDFKFLSDGHGGTDVTTPCFCRGTRVLTARGEVAVEDLQVGERVRTLSGALKPIRWIGMGRDLVTRANKLARPIVVRQGALSDGVPHRDLYLTHGHALYLDGALIPVEHLVNHRTIRWDERAQVVEYYHVELEDHDVLLAEGAPAESYHDAGNRAAFQNARPGSMAAQARPTFAPVMHDGEVVEAVWARLLARAGGPAVCDMTADPDLHLLVDGERFEPEMSEGGAYRFVVPRPPTASLLLRSRTGVPSLLGQGRSDHRPLGVAVTQLVLEQEGIATWFDYDQPQLREAGCYRHEDGFAWTDGDLQLPARFLPPLAAPFTLLIRTEPHPELRYPLPPRLARIA